jgi:hypothetical protein
VQLQEDEDFEPAELWSLGPRDLSFWIASNFRENPQHQQVLLQARKSRLALCCTELGRGYCVC